MKNCLRCEVRPASRNEAQSEVNTARPLLVRLEGASLALARARTAHWWARHRLCIQGFVGLVGLCLVVVGAASTLFALPLSRRPKKRRTRWEIKRVPTRIFLGLRGGSAV